MLKNKKPFENAIEKSIYMGALYSRMHCPRFEIVSFDQFKKDWCSAFDDWDADSVYDENDIKGIYNNLSIPVRSTKHSAGYDFKSPINFVLHPGESIMIPTGIRSYMPEDMVLLIFPRSGLGTKYRLHPANLTCVIDSDYYGSDNEGHIHIRMANNGNELVTIKQGQAFTQGIFTKYYTTLDDSASGVRNGGMGSTDTPTDSECAAVKASKDAFNAVNNFFTYNENLNRLYEDMAYMN